MCKSTPIPYATDTIGKHVLTKSVWQDSIQYGTSQDVSLLITFLPHVLFPQSECTFANIIASGISLGGHATYLALSNGTVLALREAHLSKLPHVTNSRQTTA